MKPIPLVILICVACTFLAACGKSKPMSTADFPGSYLVRFSHGSELLTLKTNGTFEQKYTPISGTAQTNVGTWEFKTIPRPILYLNNAMLFDTRANQPQIPPVRTVLGLGVWSYGKEIELILSVNSDLRYQKLAPHTTP